MCITANLWSASFKSIKTHVYSSKSTRNSYKINSNPCVRSASYKSLKTHAYSNKRQARYSQNGSKLKTMRMAARIAHKPAARSSRNSQQPKPQRWGGTPLTHPHSFASPARTNESKSKSKSISRFRGAATRAISLPLNLRYMHIIYIYIYIYYIY